MGVAATVTRAAKLWTKICDSKESVSWTAFKCGLDIKITASDEIDKEIIP